MYSRIARVKISPDFLLLFLTVGKITDKEVVKGLPQGCHVVGSYFAPETMNYYIYVTGENIPEVLPGSSIPIIEVVIKESIDHV